MDSDYPAAHSMDTEWFAVDRDGRVGVFFSGEDGHVPEELMDGPDLRDDVVNQLRAGAGLPPLSEEEWRLAWDEEYLAGLGLFVFDYPGDSAVIEPYTLQAKPECALHIDQLPPGLRERCRRVLFPVAFTEITALQPCEHVECSLGEDAPGYIGSDGKTLRPFPGREAECRALWEDFCRRTTEVAQKLRFEGDAPPAEGK